MALNPTSPIPPAPPTSAQGLRAWADTLPDLGPVAPVPTSHRAMNSASDFTHCAVVHHRPKADPPRIDLPGVGMTVLCVWGRHFPTADETRTWITTGPWPHLRGGFDLPPKDAELIRWIPTLKVVSPFHAPGSDEWTERRPAPDNVWQPWPFTNVPEAGSLCVVWYPSGGHAFYQVPSDSSPRMVADFFTQRDIVKWMALP
jgi:hypothetical protein